MAMIQVRGRFEVASSLGHEGIAKRRTNATGGDADPVPNDRAMGTQHWTNDAMIAAWL